MTTVTPTTSAAAGTSIYSGSTSVAATDSSSQTYNSAMFLKLLTTQLANQDPSSPMDSAQMVSQTAQLASMEQLTSLNKTATSSQDSQMQSTATAMLGKTVSWTDSSGNAQSGAVTSISFADATDPTLTVGSGTVKLSAVTDVATSASSSTSTATPAATTTSTS